MDINCVDDVACYDRDVATSTVVAKGRLPLRVSDIDVVGRVAVGGAAAG